MRVIPITVPALQEDQQLMFHFLLNIIQPSVDWLYCPMCHWYQGRMVFKVHLAR